MADHCCAPPPLKLDPHRGNNAYRWAGEADVLEDQAAVDQNVLVEAVADLDLRPR